MIATITTLADNVNAIESFLSLSLRSPSLSNTVEGLTSQLRETDAALDRVSVWLAIFTGMLIVGLAIELYEPAIEWYAMCRYRRSGIGSPHLEETQRFKAWMFCGAFLVFVGILGEFREQFVSIAYERQRSAQEEKRADLSDANESVENTKIKIAEAIVQSLADRTSLRHLDNCQNWSELAGVRPPSAIEIWWPADVSDADRLAAEFAQCFQFAKWPRPTFHAFDFAHPPKIGMFVIGGVFVVTRESFTTGDVPNLKAEPMIENGRLVHVFPHGTPARALVDVISAALPDVHEQTDLTVPRDTIRLIIDRRK